MLTAGRRCAAALALPLVVGVLTGCSVDIAHHADTAAKRTSRHVAMPVATPTATSKPTPAPTYTLSSGETVEVAPDQPVPDAVKKDAQKRVAPTAEKALKAKDGNHIIDAMDDLSTQASQLASQLGRPVAIVFQSQFSGGPRWTALGSGNTDLYGATGAATANKSDAVKVAESWVKGNGGVVIFSN